VKKGYTTTHIMLISLWPDTIAVALDFAVQNDMSFAMTVSGSFITSRCDAFGRSQLQDPSAHICNKAVLYLSRLVERFG